MRFSVWVPLAERVELVRGEQRFPMEPDERGWFSIENPAKPGDYYSFAVDGGDPLPDPRSAWQPLGPHGASRVVDHSAYEWNDGASWRGGVPLRDAVVYELHVGTFTPEGTFAAAASKLDHLVELGITHVELMPVAEFSGEYGWGYDGVDLYAPHHAYGTPDDLKKLVDSCHGRGLAVLLDVVYNHLGPSGNYLSHFGPYFTDRYATPWGSAMNFDGPGSDEVRRFFIDNALMWLRDYHFDGLRLDAVHAILDTSALHILEEMALEIAALERDLGRELTVIAESDLNDPRLITPRDAGGYGLDAQWSDDFHHALHGVLTGETAGYYSDFGRLEHLATALRQGYVYAGTYSRYRGRRHGRMHDGLQGHSFLAYIQNHDQVGNRAAGDRISHLVSTEACKVAAALVLASPFVPMIFMGEEWGASSPFQYFTSHPDAELGRAVSWGRKQEFEAFGWDPVDVPDPQDEATFEVSKLDWDELDETPHKELLVWYRDLIGLRAEREELRDGNLAGVEVDFDEADRWLVVRRGAVTISCSFIEGAEPPEVSGEVLLRSKAVVIAASG